MTTENIEKLKYPICVCGHTAQEHAGKRKKGQCLSPMCWCRKWSKKKDKLESPLLEAAKRSNIGHPYS